MERPLSAAFLEALPAGARGRFAEGPELEAGLARLAEEAARPWPGLGLAPPRFLAYLAARAPDGAALPALQALPLGDLYLAAACLAGLPRALRVLQGDHLREAAAALARLDRSGGTLGDDATQQLAQRLLVAPAGAVPKLAEYRGKGPLRGWLRAAAVRTALNLKRATRREAELDDDALTRLPGDGPGPELTYLQERFRPEFKAAFQAAMEGLSLQERSVLRLQVLDGLNVDQIGELYRVHRSTAARWLNRAREAVFAATRDRLRDRLHLDESEFESLVGDVRSNLDLSLDRYLRSRK